MAEHRLRVSEANRKMGSIPSVSLPAVKSCGDVPCTKDCYVVRNMYGGPWRKNILAAHNANLDFLQGDRDGFFMALETWIVKKSPDLFRFHVSGDFIDRDHLQRTIELARRLPNVGFLAFTKRHEWLPAPRQVPSNFALIASLWPGWSRRPKGYRAAWMQDGSETRIPDSAIRCPGNCETCGVCWSIRKLRRDVWFKKH